MRSVLGQLDTIIIIAPERYCCASISNNLMAKHQQLLQTIALFLCLASNDDSLMMMVGGDRKLELVHTIPDVHDHHPRNLRRTAARPNAISNGPRVDASCGEAKNEWEWNLGGSIWLVGNIR